jgi:hypothetical protein
MQNSNSLTWNHSPKLILKWWEMCQPPCLVLVAWICEFWVIKSFKNAIQAFWRWSRSKNLAESYALHKWSSSPQRTHRGWQSAGSLQYPPLLIALQLPPADTLDGCVHTALILSIFQPRIQVLVLRRQHVLLHDILGWIVLRGQSNPCVFQLLQINRSAASVSRRRWYLESRLSTVGPAIAIGFIDSRNPRVLSNQSKNSFVDNNGSRRNTTTNEKPQVTAAAGSHPILFLQLSPSAFLASGLSESIRNHGGFWH